MRSGCDRLPSVIRPLQAPEDLLIAEQDLDSVNVDHSEDINGEQAPDPVSGTVPHTTDEPKTAGETIAEAWWQQPKYLYDAQYEIFQGPSLSEFQQLVLQDESELSHLQDGCEGNEETRFPPLHPFQIESEFPFREPSFADYQAAGCTMNVHIPADPPQLYLKMFAPANACVHRPAADMPTLKTTKWRPQRADGSWDPSMLFRSFEFTSAHGPHTAKFLGGSNSAVLSPQQIWDELVSWFSVAIGDVRRATSAKYGGTRRGAGRRSDRRTKLWVIPRAAMSPEARPYVWDMRSFWQDQSAGIHPVVDGDERRHTGLGKQEHKTGIASLQQRFQCPDEETPNRMISGISTFSDDAFDGFVLGPNYSGFYDEIDFAVGKNVQELESGVLQGPYPGPAFMPCRVFATNVAIQPNGKKRRTGDGGWPRDFTLDDQDLSLNGAIDLDNVDQFPLYTLPSAITFGASLSIAATCYEFSGDCQLQMHVLLSDWVAYYRTFVIAVRYFWTQMNVFMPGGATVDTAMYFGDTGAPNTSNHAMNWLLFMWRSIFKEIISAHTSWNVHTQSEHAVSIPWDSNAKVRQWRQARYNKALQLGMSADEAFDQSLPLVMQGYFDDGQVAVASILMPYVVTALFTLVNTVGVAVEYSKLAWGRPDGTIGKCCPKPGIVPRSFSDVDFEFDSGAPMILGKEVQLPVSVIRETAARQRTAVLAIAEVFSKDYVWTSSMRSLIGGLMYISITIPALRGCLNAPIRCLKAESRLMAVQQRAPPGRKPHGATDEAHRDHLVPLGGAAHASLAQAAQLIIHQIGRCAAPWDELPQRDRTVFVMNDAAGFGGLDDVEFRGGGSWIVAPGETEVLWCVQAWPIKTVMTQNSTVLEVINANHTLEAVMIRYPQFDICEVLDNSAAVSCLKRFACDSPTLTQHMNFRQSLITHLQGRRRIFTFWSCREEGTLADMISKGKIRAFIRGLRQRGLAAPAHNQLARRSFKLKIAAL
jgi:hypothetical protein